MANERSERFFPNEGAREITLDAVTENGSEIRRFVTITFGTWKVEGKPDTGRYEVHAVRVIDGIEMPEYLYAVGAAKAVEHMGIKLLAPFGVQWENVEHSADFDGDDFYKQKIVPVTDDVWRMDEFAGVRDTFAELRGDIEQRMNDAASNEAGAEEEYLTIARDLLRIKELCGGSIPLVKSVLMGGADGGNMPNVERLGRGVNAIREAMYLAELSPAEFNVKPVSITSGKGVERHRRVSTAALVAEARHSNGLTFAHSTGDKVVPTAHDVSLMLRLIADSVGVEGASATDDDGAFDMELSEVAERFDAAAAAMEVSYMADHGRSINTHDRAVFERAKITFGAVQASVGGSGLFGDAVKGLLQAEDTAESMTKLACQPKANALLRAAVAYFGGHWKAISKERKARETAQTIEDVEGTEVKVTKAFATLSVEEAALRILRTITTYPDSAALLAKVAEIGAMANLEDAPNPNDS